MTTFQVLTNQVLLKDVVKEMEKRYVISYLLYQGQYIRYCGFDSKNALFCFADISGIPLTFPEDFSEEIQIPNPKRGFYNTPQGCLFMYRNPYRQWRRGVNQETMVLSWLVNLYLSNKTQNSFHPDRLPYIKDAEDIYLSKAIQYCDKCGSVALNMEFAISFHLVKKTGYMLWYKSFVIGEIQGNKVIIQHPYFTQEVQDAKYLWENFEVCYDTIS